MSKQVNPSQETQAVAATSRTDELWNYCFQGSGLSPQHEKRFYEITTEFGEEIAARVLKQFSADLEKLDSLEFSFIYRRMQPIILSAPIGYQQQRVESILALLPFSASEEFGIAIEKTSAVVNLFRTVANEAVAYAYRVTRAIAAQDQRPEDCYSLALKLAISNFRAEDRRLSAEREKPAHFPMALAELQIAAVIIGEALSRVEEGADLDLHLTLHNLASLGISSGYSESQAKAELNFEGYNPSFIPARILELLRSGPHRYIYRDVDKIIAPAIGIKHSIAEFACKLIAEVDRSNWDDEIRNFSKSHRIAVISLATAVKLTFIRVRDDRPLSDYFPHNVIEAHQELLALEKESSSKSQPDLQSQLELLTANPSGKSFATVTIEKYHNGSEHFSDLTVLPSVLGDLAKKPLRPVSRVHLVLDEPVSNINLRDLSMLTMADKVDFKLIYRTAGSRDDMRLAVPAYARELAAAGMLPCEDLSNVDRRELFVPMLLEQLGFYPSLQKLKGGAEDKSLYQHSPLKALRVVNLMAAHISKVLDEERGEPALHQSLLYVQILHDTILNYPRVHDFRKSAQNPSQDGALHKVEAELEFNLNLRYHPAMQGFLTPWFFHYLSQSVPSMSNIWQAIENHPYSLSVSNTEDGKDGTISVRHLRRKLFSARIESLYDLLDCYHRSGPKGFGRFGLYSRERKLG